MVTLLPDCDVRKLRDVIKGACTGMLLARAVRSCNSAAAAEACPAWAVSFDKIKVCCCARDMAVLVAGAE